MFIIYLFMFIYYVYYLCLAVYYSDIAGCFAQAALTEKWNDPICVRCIC